MLGVITIKASQFGTSRRRGHKLEEVFGRIEERFKHMQSNFERSRVIKTERVTLRGGEKALRIYTRTIRSGSPRHPAR